MASCDTEWQSKSARRRARLKRTAVLKSKAHTQNLLDIFSPTVHDTSNKKDDQQCVTEQNWHSVHNMVHKLECLEKLVIDLVGAVQTSWEHTFVNGPASWFGHLDAHEPAYVGTEFGADFMEDAFMNGPISSCEAFGACLNIGDCAIVEGPTCHLEELGFCSLSGKGTFLDGPAVAGAEVGAAATSEVEVASLVKKVHDVLARSYSDGTGSSCKEFAVIGDFRTLPPDTWANLHSRFANEIDNDNDDSKRYDDSDSCNDDDNKRGCDDSDNFKMNEFRAYDDNDDFWQEKQRLLDKSDALFDLLDDCSTEKEYNKLLREVNDCHALYRLGNDGYKICYEIAKQGIEIENAMLASSGKYTISEADHAILDQARVIDAVYSWRHTANTSDDAFWRPIGFLREDEQLLSKLKLHFNKQS